MSETTPMELFQALMPERRKLSRQMWLTNRRRIDLEQRKVDLNDSADLVEDAMLDCLEESVTDLLEYSVLRAEFHMTLADLHVNEEELAQVFALQEQRVEQLEQIRLRMRELNRESKKYGKIVPFRRVVA